MTASQTATAAPDAPSWVRATEQHELAIDLANGALVCRNARGRLLKNVPKRVRESAAADRLRALLDWLGRHEAECHARVERWMLSSMPVPAAVLAAVRPDPAWRRPLEHAVVASVGEDGRPSMDGWLGFLRGVGDGGRLQAGPRPGGGFRLRVELPLQLEPGAEPEPGPRPRSQAEATRSERGELAR